MADKEIPTPECKYGYTESQLERIFGERMIEFSKWMHGQTMSVCDGEEYNHTRKEFQSTGCGPHGFVTYSSDVERFLSGLPTID